MTRWGITLALCALMMLLDAPKSAWANWSWDVTQKVKPGKVARLSITPPTELKRVTLTLTSPQRARPITKRISRLRAGRPHQIKFKPPRGKSAWSAEIKGMTPRGELSVMIEFEIISARPLKVKFLNDKSSMREGRVAFKSDQPIARVEAQAYGDEGELQWEGELSLTRQGPVSVVTFKREITPRRLELKLHDDAGSWLSFRVVHWYAEVPHEDVRFDSGSAEVKADELPKLKAAVAEVSDEIEKFRRAMGDPQARVDLELYVGGYTDTVGQARDNLRLSQARARAIARAFKRLGVILKIRHAGFGERGQLVKTPDSTDEPRNRRALYVVSNAAPSGPQFPSQGWKTLR